MDHGSSQRPSGKLESLPKDELLKFIKRQALNSKDLKKKILDLEDALNKERQEVTQLEIEKKEWISRGVSAEFEKKDKDKEDIVDKLRQEKETLGTSLKLLQEDFESTVLESQELKDKLQSVEEERDDLKNAWEENETLNERIKDLEHQLANPIKLNKLKEEFEGLGKENKTLREKNKIIKEKKLAMEVLKVSNEELSESLRGSETKCQELEAEVQKSHIEKEKYLKAIKSMKTKFERTSLIEDELRKQLNTIVGERDELLKKNLKRNQKLKAKENTDSAKKGEMLEELRNHISNLEAENTELKEVIESHNKKTEEILSKYENLKKDFDNLNFEIDELTAIKNEQIEEKEKLTAGNESLNVELQSVRTDMNKIQLERDAITEEKEKLCAQNQSLSDEIKNLQLDIESLSDEMSEMLAAKKIQNEEKEVLFNEKEALFEELMKIKEECERHIEEKIKIQEEIVGIKKVEEECERHIEEKIKIGEEIAGIKEEFEKSLNANADLKLQLQQLQVEIDMHRKGAPETKATILKLESRVDELLNQLQTLNEEKLNQESALEELFKSHDDLSNKYDFECKEREKREREISHLEEQVSLLEAKEGKEKSTVDLEQQIAMLEETINDISVSKDHYQQELLVKEQCIQQLRNDIEEVRKKHNNTVNQDMENYMYEMDNIRNQLMSVTKELEISNREKESVQSRMIEVVSERDHSNESLAIFENKLVEVKTNLDIKGLECDELKQVIEHSTPNNSQIDINSQQDEMINLQKDLEYLDQQYKQVSSENILLKGEFQSLIATKTEYQNDLHEIKIKLDQYKKEKIFLNDKIVQYNELTEKYGYDNIYDLDNFISSLNSDVDTSTKMLQYLTVEKEQVDAKYLEIETRLRNQHTDIQEKNENVYKLENEILNLKREYRFIVDQNIGLINEKDNNINEKDNEINQKENEIKQLCNDLKQYQENIATTVPDDDTQVDSLENKQLKEDIATYQEELTNLKQAFNDAHVEMMALKTSEENHSNEILEKHILIGELKAELIGLRESFKTEQEKYDQFEDLYRELENELREKENRITQLSQHLKESQIVAENLKSELDQNNENWNELMEKYEEVQEKSRHLLDSNAQLEEHYSVLENTNATVVEEKEQAIEELNQITVVNINVENKLHSALDKVVKLQNAFQEKCEAMQGMDALLKERGDKGSKFKSVAIKAKKELEALRTKYQEETTSLEQQVIALREEVTYLEKELVRQKTECSKHEEEFEEFQAEIKSLQIQLLVEQESLKTVEDSIKSKDEESERLKETLKVSEDALRNKCDEVEKLKPEIEDIQKRLDNALQESQQMNLMNLEIVDYERTVDNLQMKLDTKEKQYAESRETIENMGDVRRNMENKICSFKKENTDFDIKNEKLKAMVVKLKKDITDQQRQQEENLYHVNGLDMLIEKLKQTNEEMKLEIANLNSEKSSLNNQMRFTVEHHEKTYQTLEVKFARVSSDLMASQRENHSLAQEFEQYKVRAHNVLKQQKLRHNEEDERGEKEQIMRLEDLIQQIKHKLQESNENFCELEVTHEELQTEHEGLQARHHEFIEEISEKELAWKQKLTQVKLEAGTKVLEYQDKLQLLQNENENLLMNSKEQQHANIINEFTNEEKEKYEEEIIRLTEELSKLKKTRVEAPPNVLEIQKQESVDSKNDSIDFKSVSERQEGEGMDSKELEIIDTLSQRSSKTHTPSSPSHASILERLLSPVEVPILSSPQSPGAMREELTFAKSSLQTALKKNDHMTALIRESEANAGRLADQAKVLKEEIRRLERNEEREQALSNMEYLKNVIIKFLKVGPVEKEQLIPVLSTMLKLSDDEKKFVFEYAKGESDDPEENGSWSSYVYRWTSLS